MKILLVCASLEPGLDGVGDYVRRLAAEFCKTGHDVMLVALNDRHINELTEDSTNNFGITRFPKSMPEQERHKAFQTVLDAFNPDWLSLQYVCYSFEKRGITFNLVKQLKKVKIKANVHIMFHEIWIGESNESTFKDKITGFFQRLAISALVKTLKPAGISTSNSFYRNCLAKAGIEANKIPIFSNMPIGNPSGRKIYEQLPTEVQSNRSDYVLATFFGGFHYRDQLDSKLIRLAQHVSQEMKKKLVITHVGKSSGIDEQFERLAQTTKIPMTVLGTWDAQDIADYFSLCDVSLANHPLVLFEKSGSIAAALYNKCPVIVLRDNIAADDQKTAEVEQVERINNIEKFINQDTGFSEKYNPESVAGQYLTMFKAS
ncbi:glycosyltransferase family 1 protein [Mucilaginibacter endophyticus]|uniref:glycosyltransferase family 1 protein n=1 Tax=Mucilaginibacter endophyticus TaxID=2675003 RepID=UPI000E0DF3EF|nr:glycosyltransferase family 1 protein [Mucilaginibacter endophyticus]